jgi:hypothetical protein
VLYTELDGLRKINIGVYSPVVQLIERCSKPDDGHARFGLTKMLALSQWDTAGRLLLRLKNSDLFNFTPDSSPKTGIIHMLSNLRI